MQQVRQQGRYSGAFCREQIEENNRAKSTTEKNIQIAAKTEENKQYQVSYRTVIGENVQITADTPKQKTSKKQDATYQDISLFPKPARLTYSRVELIRYSCLSDLIHRV